MAGPKSSWDSPLASSIKLLEIWSNWQARARPWAFSSKFPKTRIRKISPVQICTTRTFPTQRETSLTTEVKDHRFAIWLLSTILVLTNTTKKSCLRRKLCLSPRKKEKALNLLSTLESAAIKFKSPLIKH